MSRIEIQVKGLSATPVAAVVLPDGEARNVELREIILRSRAEHPSIGAPSWSPPAAASACTGKKINISTVLAAQKIVIREVDNGIWLISFMHYDLG